MNMQSVPLQHAQVASPNWCDGVFAAKAVARGGIVRRAVQDVEREIGRAAFVHEVRRRGYHLIECGGQFIVLCNQGQARLIC